MSISETPVTAPKRRPRKTKSRKPVAAAAPKPSGQFAGLTPTNCPAACNVNGCVFSGKPYCAHPYKGGLQGRDMNNEAAVDRVNAAKKLLGEAKINIEKP